MDRRLDLHGNELQTKQFDWEKSLTSIVGVIAFVYPLTAVPQLFEIWIRQNVAGVSILTWAMFMLFSIPLLVYFIIRKERAMTIMYTIWMGIYVAVISGVLIYG